MIPIEKLGRRPRRPTSITCCRNPACSSSANGFQPIHHPIDGAARREACRYQDGGEPTSHALGQCRRIIRKLGIKPIVSGDYRQESCAHRRRTRRQIVCSDRL